MGQNEVSLTMLTLFSSGGYKTVLVIVADSLSCNVDWTDRGTCILFGDAAGAVFVQVNPRIIDVATRLEVPKDRVIKDLANYGSTSAASIPLTLDEAVRSGKVKQGQTIAAAGLSTQLV
ncbi:putative beta-ketoacyl-[acyl-carrier-protein] synthase III [Helianthus anomalus]